MPVILTIAGSDPSGGAGIQSDLRTFNRMGAAGLSAITALTVQNSTGVQAVYPTPPDVLAEQLESLFEDTMPDAVKIGMLGGAAQVQVVADVLRRYQPPNIVLDPVLASTGGVPLLDRDGKDLLLSELMPLCDLITPNAHEAAGLTNTTVNDNDSMKAAGRALLQLGAKAVLLKGGHLQAGDSAEYCTESLFRPNLGKGSIGWTSLRIPCIDLHGTGCLLSSLIGVYLAQGQKLGVAIGSAKRTLTKALRNPIKIGHGRGYPLPTMREIIKTDYLQKRVRGIYVITDSGNAPSRTAEETVAAAIEGGAKIIQLREKSLTTPKLIELARRLRKLTADADALLIINDRVDIALDCSADGVHLGPDDMSPKDARRLLGGNKLIGVSTGTLAEAKAAAPFASYLGVGAIYGTQTKSDAGEPVGLDRIRQIKRAYPTVPLVAIGGINVSNIEAVAAAGADCAAVVSAVVGAPDPTRATAELIQLFTEAQAAGDSSFSSSRKSGSA